MRTNIIILVLAAAACTAFVTLRSSVISTLDVDGYFVPLVGGFGVDRGYHDPSEPATYTCIKSAGRPFDTMSKEVDSAAVGNGNPTISISPVEDVREVAVVGTIIVGTAEGGKEFFVFDTKSVSESSVEAFAQVFSDRASWIHAMEKAGIKEVPKLNDPAVYAAGVPDRILHPQHYRLLRGGFGWSDEAWGDNVIFFCATVMFLQGLLRTTRRIFLPAILLGFVAAVIADLFLGEGGPQLIAGLFGLPIEFLIVGYFARIIHWTAQKLRKSESGNCCLDK